MQYLLKNHDVHLCLYQRKLVLADQKRDMSTDTLGGTKKCELTVKQNGLAEGEEG